MLKQESVKRETRMRWRKALAKIRTIHRLGVRETLAMVGKEGDDMKAVNSQNSVSRSIIVEQSPTADAPGIVPSLQL